MTDYPNEYAGTAATTKNDDDALAEFPENHLIAQALVPKFAAALSLFGSSMILTELYLETKAKTANNSRPRDGATSRILACMSIADIFFSFGYFLTTWPAPSDLTYIRFNSGNQATCTLQGFIIQLGYVASPLFNVTLALFFLLRIRYRWTDTRLRRIEPWIQTSIWIFALACAIYPIPLEMYNNAWDICWIESYPMDCQDSFRYGTEASTCTRGDNAWIHALSFQVFPPWICVFCALIFMGMIYATVRQVEVRNTRYAGSHRNHYAAAAATAISSSAEASGQSQSQQRQEQEQQQQHSTSCKSSSKSRFSSIMSSMSRSYSTAASHANTKSTPVNTTSAAVVEAANNTSSSPQPEGGGETIINTPQRRQRKVVNHQRSDKVATQAMWYITAFFATYLLDFIASICWYVFDLWWFWLDIFAYFFLPLQGFFNFCVFARSRKMKSRVGRLARKIVCCLEGKVSVCNCFLYFCHSYCCHDEKGNNNITTTSRGGSVGGGDKNSSNPCPAALPPPSCNINDRTDHDPTTKTVKVSFASPPASEKSASPASSSSSCCSPPPPPPRNPCGNNDIIVTDEHAISLPQTVMPSTDSTRLGLDGQSQGSKTEAER